MTDYLLIAIIGVTAVFCLALLVDLLIMYFEKRT